MKKENKGEPVSDVSTGQEIEEKARSEWEDRALGYDVWYKVLWALLAVTAVCCILHPRLILATFLIIILWYLCKAKKVLRTNLASSALKLTE